MNLGTQKFLEVLSPAEAGSVTEVCINPGGGRNQFVGYFESPSLATKAIAYHDGKENIYITLNPVKRDLLGRANNKLARCKNRTADADISCDSWFFCDIDPKRPSGISSTDGELQEAISVGKQIVRYLLGIGVIQEAILTGISGNGAYVLVRLPDYEITRERIEIKKRLLNFIADQFSTTSIEVDRTVYNPARLVAAIGTLKMKGESISERPHRRSELRTIGGVKFDPSLNQRCEPFNLYALADVLLPQQGPEQKPNSKASSNGQALDIQKWMAKYGLDVANIKPWAGTGINAQLYVLRACPFNSNHNDKSAFIIQAESGALSFGCHHNSCANYRWRDLRSLYEPELVSVCETSNGGKESNSFNDPKSNGNDEILDVATWPAPLAPEAYHGLAGDIVRAIEPHTESDTAALLVQFLVVFGNVIGRNAYQAVESARHYLNLFAAIVGQTSKGRKGTSWENIRNLFERVDEGRPEHITSGLSSGEGLIWAVRDPIEKREPIREKKIITGYQSVVVDEGISDKRLLVIESELASALRVAGRDGNILTAIIRQAWDSGTLRVLTKNSPAQATGSHISIIGHITSDELRRYLDRTEIGNGFANRFLWICARRSKLLPEGGNLEPATLNPLIERLHQAVEFGRGVNEMRRDDEARALWNEIYEKLSEGKPGLLGAVVSRAEAQVLRLSCLFALLDRSGIVRKLHLEAALAVWRYAEDSACFIFGDRVGDPVADEIIKALREAGAEGMTRTAIRDLFARNRSASEITRALRILVEAGLAAFTLEESEGTNRKTERWRALSVGSRNAQTGYDINDINDLKNQEEGEISFPNTYISPKYSEDDANVVNVVNVVQPDKGVIKSGTPA